MTEYGIFAGVRTAWRHSGEGRDVILLHGWGQSMDMMKGIEDHLSPSFSVYNLDFPGFGKSDDPSVAWGVEEYRDFLADFIRQCGVVNPILIGHSFGCRVAIRYAAVHHDVYKMCLTGAAGIRPRRSFGQQVRSAATGAARRFLEKTGQDQLLESFHNRFWAEDYRNAHGIMRETFVKVVNDDVTPILGDVVCPVLLVWGDQDDAVPLWMGKVMAEKMKNAGLAVFEGDDHWAYWHQPERFNQVLDIFLKGDGVQK